MAGRLEGLVQLIRSGLTSEKLPPPPPLDPEPRRPSRLRAIFAVEPLPEAPLAPRTDRPSLLSILFARETLPFDPAPEQPRVHRKWLTFLFAPDRLDPPGGTGPEVH